MVQNMHDGGLFTKNTDNIQIPTVRHVNKGKLFI